MIEKIKLIERQNLKDSLDESVDGEDKNKENKAAVLFTMIQSAMVIKGALENSAGRKVIHAIYKIMNDESKEKEKYDQIKKWGRK